MDSKNRMDGCVCANGAKVAEIVHPYCPAHVPPEMEAELASLRAEVERCHARLEIDHHFTLNDAGETVRVDVPMAERNKDLDAVFCRDTTIELVEDENKHLAAEVARLNARPVGVSGEVRVAIGRALSMASEWCVPDDDRGAPAERLREEDEETARAWLASLPGGGKEPDGFCACGRRTSECDRSRKACISESR